MTPSRFTKVKIAIGYSLLLAILLFSLVFVHREMETLSASDDQQSLMTDSLLVLLREKDQNTIRMLRVLSEANDSLLSAREIEEIIAEQDSVVTQQRVQHRVITTRDSLITKPKKKGFFKRLAEAFVPSKQDTAVLVNTSQEFATDTILEAYNPADSLHQKIRTASEQKRAKKKTTIRRRNVQFRRLDTQLTARIDSLVKEYEQNVVLRAQLNAQKEQDIRQRSARTIGGIAVGAVLLSALFLILIWKDITRSNRYRAELEDANRRAEDLLEAREKLMLAITHDFKAPLGSIIGYTDLLVRLTEDERQRFYLDNMKSSSQHLLKLVSDLLDFHRLDLNKAEVNRVTFNPSQLFEEIRISFEPLTVAKGLVLHSNIASELDDRFISDPLRIRQIVNNLLSNAVKFTSKGEITLSVSYSSSRLHIDVTDTGKGMAAKDRERIFQEFTRLPGAQGEEGFGLGLSIVHKLVTLLEGTIDVRSVVGEGSTFTVILPLFPVGKAIADDKDKKQTAINKTDTVPVAEEDEGPQLLVPATKILLIDDDKIQLTLTAAMLEQQGIHATCCEQLDELTEQLRENHFDVLLTDVQMPAINGFDLLKLLRASNIPQAKTIPIIAVTARSDMNEAEFLEHGFAGCLHKPFTVKELIQLTIDSGQLTVDSGQLTVDSGQLTVDSGQLRVDSGQLIVKEKPLVWSTVAQPTVNCQLSTVNSLTVNSLNFKALAAFSEYEPEATRSIISSFIEETEKNIGRMKKALEDEDMAGIAGMSHKLLPLLTLIGAGNIVPLLSWLEARRDEDISDEVKQKTEAVLPLLWLVVEEARKYLLNS
ncbi:response regulator [Bacteroides sp. K03]|uniref:ATP-binding response regulator n=1 Tax=Bacteroides sp. K03 TaxID=2718928 RepID=UPI001C8B4FED|nr:ATP-binding protein [Bacteroides sp. K03]MBX9189658.1 response regulator [Bacteroides sp. K03]